MTSLTYTLEEALLKRIKKAAKAASVSVSQYMRQLVIDDLPRMEAEKRLAVGKSPQKKEGESDGQ